MIPFSPRAAAKRHRLFARPIGAEPAAKARFSKRSIAMGAGVRVTPGSPKTYTQALLTAIAINLKRVALWLMAPGPRKPRPARLTCLAPA